MRRDKKTILARWLCCGLLAAGALLCLLCMSAFAENARYRDPGTGYGIFIRDDASLLAPGEEETLTGHMKEITRYGGAAFVTCSVSQSISAYAEQCYREYFGKESGVLFMIEMSSRKIWIFCDGAIYRTITKPKANQIADNVFRYARNGEYAACAAQAFDQIGTLLGGGRIVERMKHIVNALLAAIAALMICYLLVDLSNANRRPARDVILAASASTLLFTPAKPVLRRTTRKYSPISDSNGGGGGGGGGGGSSGGGGGHSF